MKVVLYTTFKNLQAYELGDEIQVWTEDLKRNGDMQILVDVQELICHQESKIDKRFDWVNGDSVVTNKEKGFYIKKRV